MRPSRFLRPRSARVKFGATATVALLAMAVLASSAQACSYASAKQVFLRWGDQRYYVLAPNGGIESGDLGWTLAGGAKAVSGNETFNLNADSKSLSLPTGSSATSPSICASIETQVVRLMVRNTAQPSSQLRVEVTYSLQGVLHTNVVETLTAGSAWAPSPPISTLLGSGGTAIPSSFQIRFRPLDSLGSWQIDELYVDPFSRH